MKETHSLMTISPIDGRHHLYSKEIGKWFSEYALMKYRVFVESKYFVFLCQNSPLKRDLSASQLNFFESINSNFDLEDAKIIQQIDQFGYSNLPPINHDVKAAEEFLRIKMRDSKLFSKHDLEIVHFCLTSEDINNLAYNFMIDGLMKHVLVPSLVNVGNSLSALAKATKGTPMVGRTHGQKATPTTFGKECANTLYRLSKELLKLKKYKLDGKLNGSVGNFAAFYAVFPKFNWAKFSEKFIKEMGFVPNILTSQIEPHDSLAELFSIITRVNNILRDFSVDMWMYNMLGYFVQSNIMGEVGSSTMPHKINPWQLEVAEGDFQESNSRLFGFMGRMQQSRMQRDLSDHEFQRSTGEALSYSIIGMKYLANGLDRIMVNPQIMLKDLNNSAEVCFEAVQLILRKHGVEDSYNKIKSISRGTRLTLNDFQKLAKDLLGDLYENYKKVLVPNNYTGISVEMTNMAIKKWEKVNAKNISAVLFDIDGTLIHGDDCSDIFRKNKVYKHFIGGLIDDPWDYRKGFGTFAGYVAKKAGVDTSQVMNYIRQVSHEFDKYLKLDDDAIDVIDSILEKGIIVGIVTDRGPSSSKRLLDNYGIMERCSAYVHSGEVKNKKPSPESLMLACEKLNLSPKRCIYVGNEMKDLSAAIAAGMRPIIYSSNFTTDCGVLSLRQILNYI